MAAAQARPEPNDPQDTKEPGTAVARTKNALPAEFQARVEENKQRNALVAAIRGTIWGKDLSELQIRAVAQYAREVGVDPVRHVEVLGGRIYINAECYDERGAPLITNGVIQPLEPELISKDERLDKLAAEGDEWAIEESTRRLRERIKHGVPEKAAAAVVTRFRISATGAVVVGVNWCGGGIRRDPVGDAEPVKTAISRSRRRAWRQLASIMPQVHQVFEALEAKAGPAEARILDVRREDMEREQEARSMLPPRGTAGGALQAVNGYPGVSEDEEMLPPGVLEEMANADDPYTREAPSEELALGEMPPKARRRAAQEGGR